MVQRQDKITAWRRWSTKNATEPHSNIHLKFRLIDKQNENYAKSHVLLWNTNGLDNKLNYFKN